MSGGLVHEWQQIGVTSAVMRRYLDWGGEEEAETEGKAAIHVDLLCLWSALVCW